jgi:ABC-type multidrug transport system ATPase subunit
MEVSFDNLSIRVCSTNILNGEKTVSSKYLLHSLTTFFPAGSMCAILGGSGSGTFGEGDY